MLLHNLVRTTILKILVKLLKNRRSYKLRSSNSNLDVLENYPASELKRLFRVQ